MEWSGEMSTTKLDQLSPELRALLAKIRPRQPEPRPKPPLTLAASNAAKPGEAVASVALEGEDLERVRGALAGRSARIGGDEVGFDRVTHARVTMRWCRPTPAYDPPKVVSNYNPFSLDRLPGYDPDDQ
jgi:hypothetical protein